MISGRRLRDDRGATALEVVILVPVILGVFAVIVYSGRQEAARLDMEAAAQTGARTISIARDPHAAIADARSDAQATLDVGSVRCQSFSFDAAIGDAEVAVTVQCQVGMSDLTGVIPVGSVTLTATATEVLDIWRERP